MNGTNVCKYADDTTLYSCNREVKNVITKRAKWKSSSNMVPRNHVKVNEGNCPLAIFGTSKEWVTMRVGEVHIEGRDDEKLLDVTLDKKLSF